MNIQQNISDKQGIASIAHFNKLYNDYYVLLCVIADKYLKDKVLAEEAVADVFLTYWQKYDDIVITSSVKAYLIRSVQNWCFNYIEHQKVEQRIKKKLELERSLMGLAESSENPLGFLFENELVALIQKAINTLPEQCRKIFLLSRNEDLTYMEISTQLNVSINTVKTQIKIALAKLREFLKDYLTIIIGMLIISMFD